MAAPYHMHIVPSQISLTCGTVEDVLIQFSNPTELPIIYKVRATTPERYIVKPRQGIVRPLMSESISITLQRGVPNANAVDQFQVEYRTLVATERSPSSIDAIATSLREMTLATGEKQRASSHKKIITCTLSAANSAVGAAMGSATKSRATESVSSSNNLPAAFASGGAPREPSVAAAEAQLVELNKSIDQHRAQIKDHRGTHEQLQQKKRELDSKNERENAKIQQLTQQGKLERRNAPTRSPWWLALVLMCLAVAIAYVW